MKIIVLDPSGSKIQTPEEGLAANMQTLAVLLIVVQQVCSGDALTCTLSGEELVNTSKCKMVKKNEPTYSLSQNRRDLVIVELLPEKSK